MRLGIRIMHNRLCRMEGEEGDPVSVSEEEEEEEEEGT